jgi:hypothetical protein
MGQSRKDSKATISSMTIIQKQNKVKPISNMHISGHALLYQKED